MRSRARCWQGRAECRQRTTSRVTRELAIEKFPKSSIDRIWKRSPAMRRNIGKASLSFLLVLCALLLGSRASAQTQSPFITFDAPGAGTAHGQGTSALAISAAGGIVGTYTDSGGACHAFVRNPDGTFATFDSPPTRPPSQPTCPSPTSINSAG